MYFYVISVINEYQPKIQFQSQIFFQISFSYVQILFYYK